MISHLFRYDTNPSSSEGSDDEAASDDDGKKEKKKKEKPKKAITIVSTIPANYNEKGFIYTNLY